MHLKPAKYSNFRAYEQANTANERQPLQDCGTNNNNNRNKFTARELFQKVWFLKRNSRTTTANLLTSEVEKGLRYGDGFTFESLPIIFNQPTPKHDTNNFSGGRSDKRKLMELTVIRLVEQSLIESNGGKTRESLRLAREAQEAVEGLKVAMIQQKSTTTINEPLTNQPMTTGIRLFELSILVGSNLAAQCRRNGDLSEALELYTQLCKMASNSGNAAIAATFSNQQYDSSKILLNRFGLNMGNVLYEMNDFQRALKYYRLTLDRLSSLSSHRNLRMKLMYNISLTQIKMKNMTDSITTSHLLLSDNLSKPIDGRVKFDICNGNHHTFGLNLMLCLHQKGDLSSMMSLMRDLVKVDICHQYERVLFDRVDNLDCLGNFVSIEQNNTHSSEGEHNRYPKGNRAEAIGKGDSSKNQLLRTQSSQQVFDRKNKKQWDSGNEITTIEDDELVDSSGKADLSGLHKYDRIRCLSSSSQKMRQAMNMIQGDKLELLIRRKHEQTMRTLMINCNLMLELEGKTMKGSTSVFDSCLKLFAEDETYHTLAESLKINSAFCLLSNRNKLNVALNLLKEIDSTEIATSKRKLSTSLRPSNVANNLSVIQLLQKRNEKATKLASQANQVSEPDAEVLLNLANCCYYEGKLQEAEDLCKLALQLDCNSWTANYNLLVVNRKMNKDQVGLGSSSVSILLKNITTMMLQNLILGPLQVALKLSQNKDSEQQALQIVKDLMATFKQAPEIHLLASKLMINSSDDDYAAKSILQTAIRQHPYNLPVIERLVALNINSFNYEAAKGFIIDCIKNRPDQVKWYHILAECYRRAADYNRAISVYKLAIGTFQSDTSCLKALIKLMDELGMTNDKRAYEIRLEKIIARGSG